MFEHADIRALFNHSNQGDDGAQVHALAAAILAYARNIENLDALVPVVERIAYKHVGYHILPEHYPFVADALLGAISEVLGDAATPEIIEAWGEAYWFLADILKGREVTIREEITQLEGGWSGWREFVIADKIRESSVITSFVLRPADGNPVLRHRPGQYLTFRMGPPGEPAMKRNFRYRARQTPITIGSRSSGRPMAWAGLASSMTMSASATCSRRRRRLAIFSCLTRRSGPLCVSGGVGLTPMVSMIEAIAENHPGLETHYIHGTMSSATHAMEDHVKSLAQRHGGIAIANFYSEPQEGDVLGHTHDVTGFITTDWLRANTPLAEADIYLCGLKPFLRGLIQDLKSAGVSADRIHFELFGPTDEALAA